MRCCKYLHLSADSLLWDLILVGLGVCGLVEESLGFGFNIVSNYNSGFVDHRKFALKLINDKD